MDNYQLPLFAHPATPAMVEAVDRAQAIARDLMPRGKCSFSYSPKDGGWVVTVCHVKTGKKVTEVVPGDFT